MTPREAIPGMSFPREPHRPLGALLGLAQARFHEECEERLAVAGFPDLSLSHVVNVMRHVHGQQPRRIAEIVQLASVSKQAVSQQISSLAGSGYVLVTRDEQDARAKCIALTPRGQSCWRVVRTIFAEVEDEWRARHGDDCVTGLYEALERIIAHPARAPFDAVRHHA